MIFFPKDDFKYQEWSKELNKLGIKTYANKKTSVLAWLIVLKLHFEKEKIDACVFRYMNDRPSLIKSSILALSDLWLILLCKVLSIKILWILHNVDKETHEYYPKISRFRRNRLKKNAKKIFVTDPLLIDYAKLFGYSARKLDWICFGPQPRQELNKETKELKQKIIEFRNKLSEIYNTKNVYIGLCVSSPDPKCLHFLYADLITKSVDTDNGIVGLVIYGKIPDDERFKNLETMYKKNDRILHFPQNHIIDEYKLKNEIDFIYRSIGDLSVAYSVYVAASIKKPVITHDIGFIPELVAKNRIGKVVPVKEPQLTETIPEYLKKWNSEHADFFLNRFNWGKAAQKLKRSIITKS